jgi:alkaline phosphatase D
MTRMLLPAELPGLVFSRMAREKKLAGITGLAQLKAARDGGATLSERDLGRIATVLPYNLDAWDGYPAERERVFATARALGKPLVVLAGDTHNAWYAHLHDAAGNAVGVEFATHSISSPGALESLVGLPPEDVGPVTDAIRTLIDEVDYCNLHQRGYLVVTADRSAVTGEWVFLDTVHARQYRVAGSHREVFAAQ